MTKYNNPPIIEALCEFKFSEDTSWDMTIPGILFGKIQEGFPNKEQHLIQEINVLTKDTPAKAQIRKIEIARFFNDKKTTLIQVGPRTLSINQLKPYDTWSTFKSHIEYAFNELSQTIEVAGLQRIGLRYINRIEIPKEQNKVDLETYFDFRPSCGPRLPQSHGNFIVSCIFPYSGMRDLCKVELRDAMPENKDSLAFLLSIDYFLAKPKSITVAQSIEWIEEAHNIVENLFEGCILPPLREIFQEVKQ